MVVDEEETQRYFTRGRLTRGRGLRKTTGCATCRRRHVKCDEKKPVCSGCERTKHHCTYDPPRPPNRQQARVLNQRHKQSENSNALRQPRSTPDAQSDSPSEPTNLPLAAKPTDEQPQPSTSELLSNIIIDGGVVTGNSPTLANNEVLNFQQESPVQVSTEATSTSITPHASTTTSSSFGANLENATAIWVDLLLQDAAIQELDLANFDVDTESFNVLGSSVVKSPVVRRPLPRLAENGSPPTPCTSNSYLLERDSNLNDFHQFEKQNWYSKNALQISRHEHNVFQNFVKHISLWMDFFDPKRPFGTHVPQLAMHNIGLMNAILALSARHLSLNTYSGDKSTQDPNDALRYYYKTLHYIQEAMQYDSYKTSLELLATSSIVSAYEMLDGSRQDWERHLKGVFWIQRSQVIHGDSMGLKQAVWWAWLCQDVWAAFREKRRPFTFWKPLKTFDELDPYELAARSVYIFAQVVGFCSHEDIEAGKRDPLARIAAADALKDRLEDWRQHLTAEFQPLPYATCADNVFEPIWIHPPVFGKSLDDTDTTLRGIH
ncbi:Zn(II)2Cys6 transcription factor [Colletotrichum truncatum]|uniref:Zn(II)2Cys6 transcription factor n=1 Tax=Colletotrichum truncatum TaxID=5467 RepID=A0ACC3YS81_COLTU